MIENKPQTQLQVPTFTAQLTLEIRISWSMQAASADGADEQRSLLRLTVPHGYDWIIELCPSPRRPAMLESDPMPQPIETPGLCGEKGFDADLLRRLDYPM